MYHSFPWELLVSIMPSTFLQVVLAIAIVLVAFIFLPLLRRINLARSSGLPFVVVPWYNYNQPTAFLLSRFVLGYVNTVLPAPGDISWRRLTPGNWPLKLRQGPFSLLGSDTFWTVAPGGMALNTSDASVIHDIISRHSEFPKATKIYKGIEIYGENVVSSDGKMWKHHRSFASRSFNDSNNHLVWDETINKMQHTIKLWTKATVHNIHEFTSQISLGIIGRATLGQNTNWLHEIDVEEDLRSLAPGCTMTFSCALRSVAANAIAIAALRKSWIPWWILTRLPNTSNLCKSYDDWGVYMNEMIMAKRPNKEEKSPPASAVDFLDLLCQSQEQNSLTDSEVLGNLFVFIIAGHETTANTLQMMMILLAMHPDFQKDIQREVDDVFQGRSPSDWTFENDYSRLCKCTMLVAALNEEMRLISPIITIPKVCSNSQQLKINGEIVTVPADTIVRLCVPSVHKNPRYWPHGSPTHSSHPDHTFSNLDNDLEEYNPRRWLPSFKPTNKSISLFSNGLLIPTKGSFIPFSAGARSCLGQKFAKVEILVALSVVFSSHSIELATNGSDLEIASMTAEEKKNVWNGMANAARDKWQNKLTCAFTVQLNEDVPLRFVKRGEERFFDL